MIKYKVGDKVLCIRDNSRFIKGNCIIISFYNIKGGFNYIMVKDYDNTQWLFDFIDGSHTQFILHFRTMKQVSENRELQINTILNG